MILALEDIIAFVKAATKEQRSSVARALKDVEELVKTDFVVGTPVEFDSSLGLVVGVVERINARTVYIRSGKTRWRKPFNTLRRVQIRP